MTTTALPLSAVRMVMVLSVTRLWRALFSCLVMLGLGRVACFRIFTQSDRNVFACLVCTPRNLHADNMLIDRQWGQGHCEVQPALELRSFVWRQITLTTHLLCRASLSLYSASAMGEFSVWERCDFVKMRWNFYSVVRGRVVAIIYRINSCCEISVAINAVQSLKYQSSICTK